MGRRSRARQGAGSDKSDKSEYELPFNGKKNKWRQKLVVKKIPGSRRSAKIKFYWVDQNFLFFFLFPYPLKMFLIFRFLILLILLHGGQPCLIKSAHIATPNNSRVVLNVITTT
jgi:hypothetical protein